MNKEFVPYQPSLDMKRLGFDEPCFGCYFHNNKDVVEYNPDGIPLNHNNRNSRISAPLYQQVFRWFREKYNLRGFIGFRPNVKQFDCHVYDMSLSGKEYVQQRTMEEFNKDPKVGTYEEAELECLKKLIEIANEKSI
jgi:hypothetical protein